MDATDLLNREFEKRKKRNPHFSLRSFSKWLGISPAQVSQMLSGKRNISKKTLSIFAEKFDLSPIKKAKLLGTSKKESAPKVFDQDKFALIADWYHLAILALTKVKGAKPDPRWIARRLGISFSSASEALRRLVRLGILELEPNFKQIGEPFEVVSNIPSAAIRKYHKQALGLALEKIETIPLSLRQYQSLSLAIDTNQIEKFKDVIDNFLIEINDLSNESELSEVYQINVQLYPLTKIKEQI
jgi:uncharacterized protein (TIGR02147 family)